MALHIAVNARFAVLDDRGIGRYARAIIPRMMAFGGAVWIFVVPGFDRRRRRQVAQCLDIDPRRIVSRVPRDAAVLWNPSNDTEAIDIPIPQVTTIHDAAPFAFPATNGAVRRREQTPLLRTARLAERILVQSRFTADEIRRYLAIPASRITVIPLGCDTIFTPGTPTAPLQYAPYVLYVGAHESRKNTATLIQAHRNAFPDGAVRLVFTRRPNGASHALVAEARSDRDLLELYRGAMFVAVPSTYEGFGLPLLEAFACGRPALAARAGALPEVGGDACDYVDTPLSSDAWLIAMQSLAQDHPKRGHLAARGLERARLFSWDRCADETFRELCEVAKIHSA